MSVSKTAAVSTEDSPSRLLVEQRIRNRIIEYFELASSFEAQQQLERGSIAHVPHEVINIWEDWNPVDQSVWPGRLAHPYSEDEIAAMQRFNQEWEWVCSNTPDPMPSLAETQALPAWRRLREAAAAALAVFSVRGRFSEDVEI